MPTLPVGHVTYCIVPYSMCDTVQQAHASDYTAATSDLRQCPHEINTLQYHASIAQNQ
ncbi:TPA: hypothetical protein ACH3X2_000891 [Trebouxia sp. C0005]